MRFIVADWGTTRFRGYLIENETILDQVSSDEGVSALQKGQHRDVFLRQCGSWLQAEPDAPVLLEIHPPSQPEARLTLTAPALRGASVIHILITGADKLAALETALADGPVTEAPVRVVLTAPCPVTVHYAA